MLRGGQRGARALDDARQRARRDARDEVPRRALELLEGAASAAQLVERLEGAVIAQRLSPAELRLALRWLDEVAGVELYEAFAQPGASVAGLASQIVADAERARAAVGIARELAPRLGTMGEVPVRMGLEGRSRASAHGARGVAEAQVVYLDPRRVDPATREGAEVVAHEVAHVAQQRRGGIVDVRCAEREAGELGRAWVAGGTVRPTIYALGGAVGRDDGEPSERLTSSDRPMVVIGPQQVMVDEHYARRLIDGPEQPRGRALLDAALTLLEQEGVAWVVALTPTQRQNRLDRFELRGSVPEGVGELTFDVEETESESTAEEGAGDGGGEQGSEREMPEIEGVPLRFEAGVPSEDQSATASLLAELFEDASPEDVDQGMPRITPATAARFREIWEHPLRDEIIDLLQSDFSFFADEGAGMSQQNLANAIAQAELNEANERLARAELGESVQELEQWLAGRGEEPPVDAPVRGYIQAHGGQLFTGKRGQFSFVTESQDEVTAVPTVWVEWSISREGAEGVIDRGTTHHVDNQEDEARYQFRFQEVGVHQVHAIVHHAFYRPTYFSTEVLIITEEEHLEALEGEAFAGIFDSESEQVDERFETQFLDRIRSHEFQDGTVSLGLMPEDFEARTPEEMRAEIEAELERVRDLLDERGDEDPQLARWCHRYIRRLRDARDEIFLLDHEEGAVFIEARAAYTSRHQGVQSTDLSLIVAVRRVGRGRVRVQIFDQTMLTEQEVYTFQGTEDTFDDAIQEAFVELCKSYPRGTMSFRVEDLDDNLERSGQWVGFELDCNSTWEALRNTVWAPTTDLVVNLVGIVAALFPPAAPLTVAVAIYNIARVSDELAQEARTGTLSAGEVTVGMAEIGAELLSIPTEAATVRRFGNQTFRTMQVARHSGTVLMTVGGAHTRLEEIRFGAVSQIAQLQQEILELRERNPSHPDLASMEEALAELMEETAEECRNVTARMVGEEVLMLVAEALVGQVMQQRAELATQRSQSLERLRARVDAQAGGADLDAVDGPHLPGERPLSARPSDPEVHGELEAVFEMEVVVDSERVSREDVLIRYDVGPFGQVSDMYLELGPDADLSIVLHHLDTVESMRRYSGVAGGLRVLCERIRRFVGDGGRLPGEASWEAWHELEKLEPLARSFSEELRGRIDSIESAVEIAHRIEWLEAQIEMHRQRLEDDSQGLGYVAYLDDGSELDPRLIALEEGGATPELDTSGRGVEGDVEGLDPSTVELEEGGDYQPSRRRTPLPVEEGQVEEGTVLDNRERVGERHREVTDFELRHELRWTIDQSNGQLQHMSYVILDEHLDNGAQVSDRAFRRSQEEVPQFSSSSYTNSGMDRGHLLLREVTSGDRAREREADRMHLIVPQDPAQNQRGEWRDQETRSLDYARELGGVRVVVMPVWGDPPMRIGDDGPWVPEYIVRDVYTLDGELLESGFFQNY